MDLMFVEDTPDMKKEEKENLKNNISKIEKIIKVKKTSQSKYEEERETYRNDYDNLAYFRECNNKIGEITDEIERLKKIEENPYFGRLIFDTENDDIDFYIGDKSVQDDKNNNIVYDWRAPVASIFYSNQTSLKYKNHLYKLKLKRKLLIEKKKLIDCEEVYNIDGEDNFINDNFLRTLIKSKKNQKGFTDIIKSIQYKQNDIIRADLNSNIICQGSAGSGKTAIIVHRISYLLFNNPNVSAEKFLFIAPNDNFKKELNELNRKLQIDEIALKTLNEYYLDKLNEYINLDETQQINFNEIVGDLEETDSFDEKDILNKFECIKRIYIENIKKFEKLYNLDYDENLLPIENGKKVYTYILDVIKKLDNEKNSVKRNFSVLSKYLANLHLTTLDKIKIPENYVLEFNKKMDNKINEKNILIESLDKEKLNRQDVENEIKEIDLKISDNISTIKNLKEKLNSYDFFILRFIQRRKIEELQKQLEQKQYENISLNQNKDIEFKKLQRIEGIEVQLNEIKAITEIKNFGNKVFEFFNIINDNKRNYEIKAEDFVKFKNYYIKLIKQLLIDENTIQYKDEISNYMEKIMGSIKLINAEKDKKHEDIASKLRKEINPRNVIKITFNELFNKDLSDNISITRYESYLVLKILNLFGFKKNTNYNYLYLDEAQDYMDSEIKLIKDLEKCYINIFGDINQNIKGDWFQRNNWNSLKKCLGQDVDYYELNENYRNTLNVVSYCNKNTKAQMQGVGVEGKEVEIKNYTDLSEILEEAQKNNSVIITDNIEYLNKIRLQENLRCFSVKEAKGLEFQNIIVIDDELDDNSKYIAYTRTLNDLIIYRKNM